MVILLVLLAGCPVLVLAVDWWWSLPPALEPRYVGRAECVECHASELADWLGSDHDLAMDLATPDTVLGDFNQQEFTHFGVTARMFRRGDEFFIYTEGPDGKLHTYRIKYTIAVRPLQQYMVEFPRGRVQVLSIAWDTQRRRWFHLYPNERIEPDDWLHWTRGGLRKNYDRETDTYRTSWSEIDVSCEACHGPASIHVELARSRSIFWDRRYGNGLVDLGAADATVELEKCAQCHSRRRLLKDDLRPGESFYDHYGLSLLEPGLYHADGQIIEEVYVFGSFLQSRMYRKGVRCTDCHEPHSLKLRAQGNNLCTRCHLAGQYDTRSHHHHEPGTEGAACVDCHMPERLYMVIDARSDHGLKVPRPDLTISLGVPNVCNRCHEEKPPEWARDLILEWYGPQRPDDPHFAPIFAAAWAGKPEAETGLIRLIGRSDVGPIVRATAAHLLGQYPTEATFAALKKALADPYPLVRFAAVRAIDALSRALPAQQAADALALLLNDPILLVRAESARALLPLRNFCGADTRTLVPQVLQEYKQTQWLANDQAAYHNLGNLYEQLGNRQQARRAYEQALQIDARFLPSRFNLAMLYYNMGLSRKAEQMYHSILKYDPKSADAYYSLGLLVAEESNRLAEAANYLSEAAKLAPGRARIHYNYGLALQRLGKMAAAERELIHAARLEPQAVDFLYAVTQFYVLQKRWRQARAWADYLLRVEPDNPQWLQLAGQIGRAIKMQESSR